MQLLAKLALIALIVGAFWWAFQPRHVFLVRIRDGVPQVTKGRVTVSFLRELGEACADLGVSRGWVGGVRRGKRVTLAFSRNIGPSARQRLRNLWALHE